MSAIPDRMNPIAQNVSSTIVNSYLSILISMNAIALNISSRFPLSYTKETATVLDLSTLIGWLVGSKRSIARVCWGLQLLVRPRRVRSCYECMPHITIYNVYNLYSYVFVIISDSLGVS